MKNLFPVLSTLGWLLRSELNVIFKRFWNSLLDSLIIPVVFILIGGYILPSMGMPANYGSFMVVSSTMMMAYSSTAWSGAFPFLADLESDKSITYALTLPLPSWLVFVKVALGFAIPAALLNLFTLPVGKLLLGAEFDLSHFSMLKFILIYPIAILSFAFFSTMIAFWVNNTHEFGRFWLRIGSQLFFFSGLQFSWGVLKG